MKIKEITETCILFDNGNSITYDHERDCCECNYAEFAQIDEEPIYSIEFDENLKFESVEGAGFRFGSNITQMIFVPCYSMQNGYYTDVVDIYYNGKKVLSFCAELVKV